MSASATSPTAPFSPCRRLILLAVLVCLPCSNVLAQATPTAYTSDMPSVERVKAEIKGSDPTDALARQVAVFTYPGHYIQRIKYNRTVRGPYTPDEQRLMSAYSLAAYEISQTYAKTHTPDETKAFERLHGRYEMDTAFYDDWSKRLIGKQSAAAYKGAETDLAAHAKAHFDEEKRVNDEARAAASKANGGLSDDPTAVAMRRCLELGGDAVACGGKSFVGGLLGMVGLDTSTAFGPSRAGVVLSGVYHNPGTLAKIDFSPEAATIQNCGKLVADGHGYTIRKSATSVEILIQNEPRPILLSMRSNGALIGPGPTDIKGRIITGYYTSTKQLYVNGQPAVGATYGCSGACTTTTSIPEYAPKIERCTIATLSPPPPNPPASASAPDSGIFGTLTSMIGTVTPTPEPGLRMVGKYSSSSGLLLDFDGAAVTIDCGQAHVKSPYTIENTPSRFVVNIQNSGGPFSLAVAPDNTLRGSGSTTVNGRLVSGMRGDDVTFTPRSERCEVGTFAPKSAASSTSIAANTSATPPAAEPVSRASAAPVGAAPNNLRAPMAPTSAPSPSPVRASMRVAITADFPSGSNPMVGQSVFVMKEPMDEVLRKLGIPVPPNSTPGQAMQTLAATCRTTDCRPVFVGMGNYYVTTVKLDSAGRAVLSAQAATGLYFIYALIRTPNGTSYIWDIPANLHAGDNIVTLTATNAELVH